MMMENIDLKIGDKEIQGRFNWENLLERHKIPLSVGLIGLILLIAGFLWLSSSAQQKDKIEIITSEQSADTEKKEILADIEGAVIKPGVYELPSGSRMDDLLIAAGGLSATADRDWVEKTLNKAQKLVDGTKIYIPSQSETPLLPVGRDFAGQGVVVGSKTTAMVNINTTSQSELEALWGVGPVTAKKIIENRPYQSIEELLSKKIVYKNVFEKIKGEISVY